MTRSALEHEYPRWEMDPDTREDHFVWPGKPRFVSAKRARKLRKRGVPLMPCHAVQRVCQHRGWTPRNDRGPIWVDEPTTPDGRARYCWFETEQHYAARIYFRHVARLEKRYASRRAYVLDWYNIEIELPPEQRAQRMSPTVTVTIVAPENPGGLTYDMSRASLLYTPVVPDTEVDIE